MHITVLDSVSSSLLVYRTAVFVLLLVRAEGRPCVKEQSLTAIRLSGISVLMESLRLLRRITKKHHIQMHKPTPLTQNLCGLIE